MPILRAAQLLILPVVIATLATELGAQGRGKNDEKRGDRHGPVVVQQGHPSRPKYRKVRNSDEAVDVTRIVLREQGYDVVRIERRRDARIVYYRRGNMGRGRGKGPIMYMVVRPARDRIIVERAPSPLLMQINVRLGY